MNQGELTLAISKRFFLTQTEAGELAKQDKRNTVKDQGKK